MNKKFSNIIFISALAILAIILGINIVNGFRNIEVKNIYGSRSELGDVSFSVKKNLGSFFYKDYNIGADSANSKMMFIDESDQGVDLYKNKDALRGVFISNSNSYEGTDYLAVVNTKYETNILELVLKDKKTGEVKKTSIENDGGSNILAVYGEKDKIKILIPESDSKYSCPLVIKQYNFETKVFNEVAKFGSYSEKMVLEYKGGDNFYIGKIIRNYDEKKNIEEITDLNIYKVNLKDNSFKDYDVRKILEENKIDLNGVALESAECDGKSIYVKMSDSTELEKTFNDEQKMKKYRGIKSEVPRVYSVATINLENLTVDYYKNVINENEIEEYVGEESQPMYLKILNNKLYFLSSVENSSLSLVGVVDLSNSNLVYLGKMNNVKLNGFNDKN